MSLPDLFELAANAAATRLEARDQGKYYQDMRYEFEILGDHGMRLCSPGGRRS